MNRLTDPAYLRGQQYRSPSNLSARQRLHVLYSTNPISWFRWVFDRLALSEHRYVLELGCGSADLWAENLGRVPQKARIILSDFSPGMLSTAAARLGRQLFRFTCLDAQHIPFPDACVDLVVANHMLYHLPDLQAGLHEIRRVLRPGGRLCAATNGLHHMQEVFELTEQVLRGETGQTGRWTPAFNLENGRSLLEGLFEKVDIQRLPDALQVTEAGPLVDYILSMSSLQVPPSQRNGLEAFLTARIQQDGAILITKDSGMVTALRT